MDYPRIRVEKVEIRRGITSYVLSTSYAASRSSLDLSRSRGRRDGSSPCGEGARFIRDTSVNIYPRGLAGSRGDLQAGRTGTERIGERKRTRRSRNDDVFNGEKVRRRMKLAGMEVWPGGEIYCKIISYLPATFADVSSAAAFSPRLPHYF